MRQTSIGLFVYVKTGGNNMDEVVVAVMAVVMIGAGIWGWRIENLPDADQKTKKSNHSEQGGK